MIPIKDNSKTFSYEKKNVLRRIFYQFIYC